MKELYNRNRECYVVDKGTYKDIDYVIKSIGSHPTAYVNVQNTQQNIDIIDNMSPIMITYESKEIGWLPGLDPHKEWLGWDYGHAGDYLCFRTEEDDISGHKYTYEEVMKDVKAVIEIINENEEKMLKDIFEPILKGELK